LSHNFQSTKHFKLGHESNFHNSSNSQRTQIRSWHHFLSSVLFHRVLQTGREIICSNPHDTSNCSWKLSVPSFPIHIALHIRSWQHSFTSVPIYRAPQFRSWHHTLSSVLINIFLQVVVNASCHILSIPESALDLVMTSSNIICFYPYITSNLVTTSSSIICSNPHSTSIWFWKLLVTSFPIHIILHIMSWEHYFSSAPIHNAPQIMSWNHPLSSVLIRIVLQIGRDSFL
jgi:hypothetical protein